VAIPQGDIGQSTRLNPIQIQLHGVEIIPMRSLATDIRGLAGALESTRPETIMSSLRMS
jgi:hypothetical protein